MSADPAAVGSPGRSAPGPRSARPSILEWGSERARAGPWHEDEPVAHLRLLPHAPPPSPSFLRHCLSRLAAQGFTSVVTSALAPSEQRPFLQLGFEEHERLHLLSHDLARVPEAPAAALARARGADRPAVLQVDALAFPGFWRLDDAGLDDALQATPDSRFRVVLGRGEGRRRVLGYCVSGRAGPQGYLQRLAVHPDHRRRGLGRALVVDGMRWMRRRGARQAVVNTQLENEGALALYLDLGFQLLPSRLAVLRRDLVL